MTTVGSHPLELIARLRVVPVIVIDDAARSHELGDVLVEAGLPIAEITLRTPSALDAAAEMSEVEGMTVGVGSVISASQVSEALSIGAQFIVSPGFSAAIANECRACTVPWVPGISTATELLTALDAGLTTVKFFPAEQAGGIGTLKALSGPFPDAKFIPTGGVNASNLLDYLRLESVLAVGGSWMVPRTSIANGELAQIGSLAKDAQLAAAGIL